MLIFNALRASPQTSDSINRPYSIVLLVFTALVVMAAAPYPRAEASGGSIEGACFYSAKTLLHYMSYIHTKKTGTIKVPAPVVLKSTYQRLVRLDGKDKHYLLLCKLFACNLDTLQSILVALYLRTECLYNIALRLTFAAHPITQRIEHIKLVWQLAKLLQ